MYYPFGWPVILSNGSSDDQQIVFEIVTNSDRSLICFLTENSISIWQCKLSVFIVKHTRNQESIDKLGKNLTVVWRPDSSMLVIQTNKDYILYYKIDCKHNDDGLLEQKDVNIPGLRRESAELFLHEIIPVLYLVLVNSIEMNCGITCIMAAEEEVVIGTKTGEILGVNWDGTIDESFRWKLNTPQLSLSTTTVTPKNESSEFNLVDLKYSSMIGGFAMVFSSGRAAFMPLHFQSSVPPTPESPALPTYNSRLQFVHDIENAVLTAINHKYQLIAFGLKNAEGILCCLDDSANSVITTHKLVLPQSAFPDAMQTAGSMTQLQWTPDSMVLATAWEKGAFALWSVFGALLVCSLSWDFGLLDNMKLNPFKVLSIAWGKEGYHLWLSTKRNKKSAETTKDANGHFKFPDGVCKMKIAKSVLASNPSCACSEELVLLVAEDRLFLGVGAVNNVGQEQSYSSPLRSKKLNFAKSTSTSFDDDVLPSTNVSSAEMYWEQQPVAVGNHQWIVICMPQSYLSTNWPIRYAAIDSRGQHIAIAGRSGMAHYSLVHRKWKLFGNETQEKDFEVLGGLLWWNDHIVLSCYNAIDARFEIRCYPQKTKLDNQFVRLAKVSNEVLLMSMFSDRLLTFLIDGSLHLYAFLQKLTSSTSTTTSNQQTSLHIIHLSQITVSNLIVPPECVNLIVLTNLHIDATEKQARKIANNFDHQDNSILMNVCGRLFLLERDPVNSNTSNPQNDKTNNQDQTLIYKSVSILASGVENIWVSNLTTKSDRPHLTQSLWLSCGSHGMGVWLPLLSDEKQSQQTLHNFMSKRIMLPINTHIYPLAVLFRDAVVLGAENDTILYSKTLPISLPFSVISRTSQVYLHHILRELLRRNLGYHSWEIANSCKTLPYFPHSLELLLHEVLEEEAASSQPIPDALLPRVIDFIKEFPFFLQTVVHCARKTELALWPHLFSIVGNPKELFQRSMQEGQLETAASYIIILQNLERSSISKQYATQLLEVALNSGRWQLAKDLVRFLSAIDPLDVESPPTKTTVLPNGIIHPHSIKYLITPPSTMANSENNHDQNQKANNHNQDQHKNHVLNHHYLDLESIDLSWLHPKNGDINVSVQQLIDSLSNSSLERS